ncbi:hypothetical protein NP233_g12681 [Leucocoprinus birnbaumii]|uniref:Uncharacterized protein n=1 Tax=Leucocoprinus birnbaumii TaxID=56174 RepID=A0AAD5VI56_9AGAR|nr:hypothetical protein NP233_g12681 [Leucocoprinus birnbaumii]
MAVSHHYQQHSELLVSLLPNLDDIATVTVNPGSNTPCLSCISLVPAGITNITSALMTDDYRRLKYRRTFVVMNPDPRTQSTSSNNILEPSKPDPVSLASVIKPNRIFCTGPQYVPVSAESHRSQERFARCCLVESSMIQMIPDESVNCRAVFKWVRGELVKEGGQGRVYLAVDMTTGKEWLTSKRSVQVPMSGTRENTWS